MNYWESTERRRHARKSCLIAVEYIINNRLYKDFIQNVSAGGALIETSRPFFVGDEIAMSFQLPESRKPVHIKGYVAWTSTLGIGIRFRLGRIEFPEPKVQKAGLHDQEKTPGESIDIKGEGKKMGKVKKKRVRWQPSASLDVSTYKLYWSKYGEVNYNSDHVELGNVTEVVLPDGAPSFPLDTGDIELGVTAINQAGNESDMTKLSVHFNFTVPDAPQNLEVEDV